MTAGAHARSCASCNMTSCALHIAHGPLIEPVDLGKTAWLLDDAWPEYASYLAAMARDDDQLLAPGLFGAARIDRYDWRSPATRHTATVATARRHWTMRRVANAAGSVRQAAYLRADRKLAVRLAKAIDFRTRHLVIAQIWLPWLDRLGVLGGRTFDVLMSRYPLAEIHRRLDRASAEFSGSIDGSITDFRAPVAVVDSETRLLATARRIISPHHDICSLFPGRASRLAWHRPDISPHPLGTRTAYIGSTLARDRPDLARRWAADIDRPLIVFHPPGTRDSVWNGMSVEHRHWGAQWHNDIGTIIHPATMTAQPRRLLQALAAGATVVATSGSGLAPADYSDGSAQSADR